MPFNTQEGENWSPYHHAGRCSTPQSSRRYLQSGQTRLSGQPSQSWTVARKRKFPCLLRRWAVKQS